VLLAGVSTAGPVRVSNRPDDPGRLIKVNNVAVMRLVSGAGSLSLPERASLVESRLRNLSRAGTTPAFRVERRRKAYWVTVNGGFIACPTSEDAAFVDLDRKATALRWASRLRQAWQTPLLRMSPTKSVVGVGATGSFRIAGAAEGPISVRLSPEGVGKAALDMEKGFVKVTGLAPGHATLHLTRDGETVSSALTVMAWAGSVVPMAFEVTGRQVPRDLLRERIMAGVPESVRPASGCWYSVRSRPTLPLVWSSGDTLETSVAVRLSGPGHLPVETSIPVRVTRVAVPPEPPVALFYSNKPESVTRPQVLFRQRVTADNAARLLYHHQNKTGRPLELLVDLSNEGRSPVRVQVIEANGPVTVDAVQAGYDAATRYLRRRVDGAGIIVTLPPGARRSVLSTRLAREETASGLLGIRPLDDGSVRVDVEAREVSGGVPSVGNTALATAVFPSPDKVVEAKYTVGGPWTHIPIGRYPVSNGDGARLAGNYGVFYDVRLQLENPRPAPAKVRILFEPLAGAAQGAFLIDGEMVKTRRSYPPMELPLKTVILAPNETRTVRIVTMPAAGGSYPAGLIVNGG
jgi:hypothetical protein